MVKDIYQAVNKKMQRSAAPFVIDKNRALLLEVNYHPETGRLGVRGRA